jgi:hypothetical protein
MIQRILFLAVIALFLFACGNESEENTETSDSTVAVNEEMKLIPLADFEAVAGDYVGKEIKIHGIVDHVCKHGGKKILVKSGDHKLHVMNDERYSEELNGSEIELIGVVEEEKIDEAYLQEELDHVIESHNSGTEEDKKYVARVEEWVTMMRDSLKTTGAEYFPEYSLKYVSHVEINNDEASEETQKEN